MLKKRGDQNKTCVSAVCKNCGVDFFAIKYEVKRGGGKFCSRTCQRSQQAKKNAAARIDGLTAADRKRAWIEKTPKQVHVAHKKTEWAIESGALVRQPCELCGAIKVDAHHDDYSKPLEVRWLCRKHHLLHHRYTSPGTWPTGSVHCRARSAPTRCVWETWRG